MNESNNANKIHAEDQIKSLRSCRENRQLRLYIHVPFCVKKCNYCDFYSQTGTNKQMEEYTSRVVSEILEQSKDYSTREVVSIYFGGGTPSILPVKHIRTIVNTLKKSFHVQNEAEITIEVNPRTATYLNLLEYYEMGFNRISIGMQTTDDDELRSLGRAHTFQDFLNTFAWAREAGFLNLNVDVMAAIPGQSLSSYQRTLRRICELKPEHISSYSLILEEGTNFYDWYVEGNTDSCDRDNTFLKSLPSEDEEREMYLLTQSYLAEQGYVSYEISNYAKPGYACKHNIGYWKRDEYLGFGPTAASFVNHTRWTNDIEEKHHLTLQEEMEEFMFLGLRMTKGILVDDFEQAFQKSLFDVFGNELRESMKEGLLEEIKKGRDDHRIRLTTKGIDLSNFVFAKFINLSE